MKIKIAPSIIAADFGRLIKEVELVEKAGCDLLHIDVMDGCFVPDITLGRLAIETFRRGTDLPLDVHLMVQDPTKHFETMARAGASMLTVHVETVRELEPVVRQIQQLGLAAGISLRPATELAKIIPALELVDLVLVMGVDPGFSGQQFQPAMLQRIRELAGLKGRAGFDISVDGGVGVKNIRDVVLAGADTVVSGSGIFNSVDYAAAIKLMREISAPL